MRCGSVYIKQGKRLTAPGLLKELVFNTPKGPLRILGLHDAFIEAEGPQS